MTVEDLIKVLQKLPADLPIYIAYPNGEDQIEPENIPFYIGNGKLYIEVYDTYVDGTVSWDEYLGMQS